MNMKKLNPFDNFVIEYWMLSSDFVYDDVFDNMYLSFFLVVNVSRQLTYRER